MRIATLTILCTLFGCVNISNNGDESSGPILPSDDSEEGGNESTDATPDDTTGSTTGADGSTTSEPAGSTTTGEPGDPCDGYEPAGIDKPYDACGSYCLGECIDDMRCVVDSFDDPSLGFCSQQCIIPEQCAPSPFGEPWAVPICQLGQCYIGCDQSGECPDGFSCYDPEVFGYARVCMPDLI